MLVECVPNFSEGRDDAVIERLCEAVRGVPGAALLDRHSDRDHQRSVLTFAGSPAAVSEAAFRAVAVAVDLIDMTVHRGCHPRIGAADVVPFVPLEGATMADCVGLAHALGKRLAHELDLPVYFYGRAARRTERQRLAWIRRPQFEGLGAAMATEERAPDLGPPRPHPTAGATVVGARDFLLAFNVDLETSDLKLARRLARALRASSGGLPGVQAIGLRLPEQGRVQVSMNLVDLPRTGPGLVYRELARLAAAEGVALGRSELVGLMPSHALREASQQLLGLPASLEGRVLEDRLEAELVDPHGPLSRYLHTLAGPGPYDPGGGSAAALALALGRACFDKAVALSRGGKGRLSEAELDELAGAAAGPAELLLLAREDHEAFADLMGAFRRSRQEPGRKEAIRAARTAAVEVPERLLAQAVALAEAAARLAEAGNPNLVNDAAAAAELALAAGRVGRLNARTNQRGAEKRSYAELLARLEAAAARARAAAG